MPSDFKLLDYLLKTGRCYADVLRATTRAELQPRLVTANRDERLMELRNSQALLGAKDAIRRRSAKSVERWLTVYAVRWDERQPI